MPTIVSKANNVTDNLDMLRFREKHDDGKPLITLNIGNEVQRLLNLGERELTRSRDADRWVRDRAEHRVEDARYNAAHAVGDVIKIVSKANNVTDNLDMLRFREKHGELAEQVQRLLNLGERELTRSRDADRWVRDRAECCASARSTTTASPSSPSTSATKAASRASSTRCSARSRTQRSARCSPWRRS
jgi:hypothetical protein